MVYLLSTFCFFFFKQKTAYEMRISDWSSDVCSSDLKVRIILQHFTRMSPHLAPDWPEGHGWIIEMEGEPSIRTRVEIGDHNSVMPTDDACMATAMHVVHAVPYVVAAKPGILTLADVPPIWGKEDRKSVGEGKSVSGGGDMG